MISTKTKAKMGFNVIIVVLLIKQGVYLTIHNVATASDQLKILFGAGLGMIE